MSPPVKPRRVGFSPPPPPILLVSHAGELGGAEQGLLDLAAYLGPERCQALLFTGGPLEKSLERRAITVRILAASRQILGVRRQGGVMRTLGALPATLGLAWRFAAAARPYHLLYANSQKAAFFAMLLGTLTGRRVIWHLHDILSAEHFAWLQRHAIAFLSNHGARAVIVVSHSAQHAFIASGGKASRVRLIHNGVDPAPFAGLPDLPTAQLRQDLGLPGGKLVGLFGRITQWKGQRVLIEALSHLPDTQALIVGSPMFGEDAELAYLIALAKRSGVADRVHFLGYRADTPLLMRAVDLVVHCSTAPEPFGRVIVEALLAGTAVLAAEGGASAEILGDGAEWLVSPGDSHALAKAIAGVLNTEAASLAGKIATLRARMMQLFTLDSMMAKIERVIAETA